MARKGVRVNQGGVMAFNDLEYFAAKKKLERLLKASGRQHILETNSISFTP